MSAPTRVLLVDDHAVMRAGFRMILDAADDILVVGEAATGVEALAAASALQPDVVCMDVQMPDMDGLEATRRIVADPHITAAVVIVTTFDRDDYLFQALSAGASGFLLKNAGPEDLTSAVRVAAAGDALLAPEVTRRVIERFTSAASTPAGAAGAAAAGAGAGAAPVSLPHSPGAANHARVTLEQPIDLTEREAEVLQLLARARSNAEIARELFIGEATVKTHVSNVLQKLGARDRVAAVVYAHTHGLV
ncbi:response regulator transcription factor [Microbacterium sp. zg-YB36]|uniref:response regulator n=1 Tax=Microbacterium sp. zg-YB36 TaxID=2969407 RepID=UPI00214BCE7E|nr:response regulator transcription factor [Microbacterium sp. zg-YB36]MDL5352018.1 response regulator transcription factor [Microbacterium sp. zg-YB36]